MVYYPTHRIDAGEGNVIVGFKDRGTEDVYDGADSKAARKRCPSQIWKGAWKKLDMIAVAANLTDLAKPPGNRLEKLSGDRAGQHSIRINDQYRVCFTWTDNGAEDVEITDYH